MMKKTFLLLLLFQAILFANAQKHQSLDTLSNPQTENSIYLTKLCSDKNSSSFVIWVKDSVPKHYHAYHTETIVVLEGEAEMFLDGKWFSIKKHDFIEIPPTAIHAVRVTTNQPLKVLSTQAPEFKGEDRHFIK